MPLLDTNSDLIILASRSPRRIDLLKKIIPHFQVDISDIDEDIEINDPIRYVLEISKRKVCEVAHKYDKGIIIGADSIVVRENRILGKPKDKEDAIRMLNFLSGQIHQVYTGFTILKKPSQKMITDYEVTHVKFRDLADWEILKYIEVAHPFDKAGSYGIQDESAVFVESIDGCFYNVMGLPVAKIYNSLLTLMNH